MKKIKLFILLFVASLFIFYSCNSAPSKDNIILEAETENIEIEKEIDEPEIEKEYIFISRKILDSGKQTSNQMAAFFLAQNPQEEESHILNFASLYIEEASTEGINWDVAFAQMCLETGFLRFGGLVQPEWHNYCGLGAMDAEHPGCIFETEQLGIRAHIQHLQAYATTEETTLVNELIDPRYNWVHKTKFIEDINGLTGTWATDPIYAEKLENILQRMETMINQE